MHDDGEVIDTIYAVQSSEPQLRPLEQCPTCRRYIDRSCSVCSQAPAPPAEQAS